MKHTKRSFLERALALMLSVIITVSMVPVNIIQTEAKGKEGNQSLNMKTVNETGNAGNEATEPTTEQATEPSTEQATKPSDSEEEKRVTVIYNTEQGDVVTNPVSIDGKVIVRKGEYVNMKAIPNPTYRVSQVILNNQVVETFMENTYVNTNPFSMDLLADQDYVIEIVFSPMVYRVTAGDSENGSVEIGNAQVDYNGSSKVILRPNPGYTLASVQVNAMDTAVIQDQDGISFTMDNITEDKNIEAAFVEIAKADLEEVIIPSEGLVREDAAENLYVYEKLAQVTFQSVKGRIMLLDTKGESVGEAWDVNRITLTDSQYIGGIRLYYQADGEMIPEWHEVKTVSNEKPLRIVIDKMQPEISLKTVDDANDNGYYNKDVILEASAVEEDGNSGIGKAEYWITLGNEVFAPVLLYSYQPGAPVLDRFETDDTNKIVINASLFSHKDVKVTLRVTDRAGNVQEIQRDLKINAKVPTVDVSMEDTPDQSAQPGFYQTPRTAKITVNDREDTFSEEAVLAGIKIKANGIDKILENSKISWKHDGEIHTGTLEFTDDAHYSWSISYTNLAGVTNSEVGGSGADVFDFTVDQSTPTNLSITYSPPVSEKVVETSKIDFYKEFAEVTIAAEDITSGVEQFVYSYIPQNEASPQNQGISNVIIERKDISYHGATASATFKIPAPFCGYVSFYAVDKSGNKSYQKDKKLVVVDNTAPEIEVSYDYTNSDHSKYYARKRIATIRIKEANFFLGDMEDIVPGTKEEYLAITVGTRNGTGSVTQTKVKPEFSKDEDEKDVYIAQIPFEEDADYTFGIKYTDRSGNVYASYAGDNFTIDKTAPKIKVSYDNNLCTPDNLFKDPREAAITITDRNFHPEGVSAAITADGELVSEYTEYLKKEENWNHNGDIHTAKIKFEKDAHYTFDISCADMAGNINNSVDYGISAAPQEFTLDCSAPEKLTISYEPSFNGNVLENVTYGFYKTDVKVKIEAEDATAGIEHFIYTYAVQKGAGETNTGKTNVEIDSAKIEYEGKKASYTFEIPAQFRGYVSFKAVDKAGNTAEMADKNVVVVDTVAPGVTVSYDNNNSRNGRYFDKDRTATITMKEDNFFAADLTDLVPGTDEEYLVLTVGKTLDNNTRTETKVRPTFTKNGDEYKATVKFDESADYTFDIKYTDRSGNVYDSYTKDEFTIDKKKPQISIAYDNTSAINGTYYKADRTAVITVEEHNFRPQDIAFAISAVDVTGNKEVDLSEKGYQSYLRNQANWTRSGDKWTARIKLNLEGNYSLKMTYSDLAGNTQVKAITDAFCIDKSKPKAGDGAAITYSKSVLDSVLEKVTFGFYKAPVTVTIQAEDEYAGIDRFVYSYLVEANASSANVGKSNVVVRSTDKNFKYDKNKAAASFIIDAQFRGSVSFTAVDKAGNMETFADSKVIIVDNVAPGVKVTYDNNHSGNGSYFRADRTASITITEANFFGTEGWSSADLYDKVPGTKEEYLVITVGKTLNDGTRTETKVRPVFKKNGDVYTAAIKFSENADYTFDIKYTDRSGNVYDGYEKDRFTIDKIKPVIQVTYDNNSYKNKDQFKADRSAKIVITEHNFKASNVAAAVTANGIEVEKYASYLKDEKNWSRKGDTYTARIKYRDEAHYTFHIRYTDPAGNKNKNVNYGKSAAPEKFTLDKSAPDSLDIQIHGESILGSMETLAFNKFYADSVIVNLFANGDISGLESLTYQKVSSESKYDVNGTWITYNQGDGISVSPSEKFIIYLRAEDRAGNVSIVRSTGIVADNQKPGGENNAPAIDILPSAPNSEGFHNSDVAVAIKVADPRFIGTEANASGYCSGLNKITYKIYTSDTDAVEEGTLLDAAESTVGAAFDEDGLISFWTGNITVRSAEFNSNQVIIEVTAADNAGNILTSTTKPGDIQIDITAPVIKVSYSNNSAESQRFFKADRIATIEITDRNFKPEDVKSVIKNTQEVIPEISNWRQEKGDGNLDNTKWAADITYDADGDYEFEIEYTDMAGNKSGDVQYGDSIAPTAFTIDKTVPAVEVTYDNNNAMNGNYYKESRTATIVINEHNFDGERVRISLTASDDGMEANPPTVSEWISEGDKHTAKILYKNDARYSFDISITDRAGNVSEDFEEQTFYIDQTAPVLEITGVANQSANNNDVIPVVSYSDTNYDPAKVTITLKGANRKFVQPEGLYTKKHNGATFTFQNFEKEKIVDDIYTLTASLTDKAGNTATKNIIFSVNRFGSTYALSRTATAMNGSYVQNPVDVVLTETNANELKNIKITLFKNQETLTLTEGTDYQIDVEGGKGQWYHYTYTVFKKNFEDDGAYRVTVYSEDTAENVAENTLDTKGRDIRFGVDKTSPNIVVANLESDTTYPVENMTVSMSASDNLYLSGVSVYLDDYSQPYCTWTEEEIAAMAAAKQEFTFDVLGSSTRAHRVKIVGVDGAGNEQTEELTDFYVTTNRWVRYFNNKPLFFGSAAGVIALAGLMVLLVRYRRRRGQN